MFLNIVTGVCQLDICVSIELRKALHIYPCNQEKHLFFWAVDSVTSEEDTSGSVQKKTNA